MLSQAENDLLTLVGPGQPAGELLRRYWMPVAIAAELTAGQRTIVVHPRLDCNWFQAMENSVDPAHLQILHQEHIAHGKVPPNTTRGFIDDVTETEFRLTPFGIIKHRVYLDGRIDEHPLIFPNILRQGPNTQIRVPIDDTHTNHIDVNFKPTPDGSLNEDDDDPPVE